MESVLIVIQPSSSAEKFPKSFYASVIVVISLYWSVVIRMINRMESTLTTLEEEHFSWEFYWIYARAKKAKQSCGDTASRSFFITLARKNRATKCHLDWEHKITILLETDEPCVTCKVRQLHVYSFKFAYSIGLIIMDEYMNFSWSTQLYVAIAYLFFKIELNIYACICILVSAWSGKDRGMLTNQCLCLCVWQGR